ncbi:MAG: GreA/GreB family elongation factor [Planctomycetes bacterium]|nr:GreA/GreB family elongation factor [Planctomycetota bacterium]
MNTIPPFSLASLAAEGRFAELEEQWMASVEEGRIDLADCREAAALLAGAGAADTAGALLACLLEQIPDADPDEELLEFAEEAVRLAIGDRSVRAQAAAIHRRAGRPELGALLATLDQKDGAVERDALRRCLRFKPGAYVAAAEGAGPERIESFDPAQGAFVLSDGSTQRTLAPAAAAAELTLLEQDDFRALMRFNVAALKEKAESDPSGLVQSALAAMGGRLEWEGLKKLLLRGVVPRPAFARWWNRARGQVERNPMIQVFGDKQPILILRTAPITHEEELTARIAAAPAALDRIRLVVEYLGSIGAGHAPQGPLLQDCAQLLAGIAADASAPNAVALLAAAVHAEVAQRMGADAPPLPGLDALFARAGGFGDASALLEDEELIRRALVFLRERNFAGWAAAYAESLPGAPGRLTDMLARTLLAEGRGEALARAIQLILATPDRHGHGLFWLWKAATSGALDAAPGTVDRVAITLALLRLMDRWARSAKNQITPEQRALLGRMRVAVGANKYQAMNLVLNECDDGLAVQLHQALASNQGVTDVARYQLQEALKARFADAILGRKELWEEDVIYVSPRGLKAREDEYQRIVNVDMLKNSEAIGHAAGFGDLSENAEFTAALEQRDFLSQRANEIGDDIRRARAIPFESIGTDRVNVGTTIRVREVGSAAEQSYTFLGPWDADLERGVYSYLAPIARAFLGRSVGEVVEASGEHGVQRLEILSIERAAPPD